MFDWPSSPSDGQIYSPSNQVSYQWSAATGAWLQLGTSTPVQVQIIENVYTSSGTWTKQPNLSYADVELMSAGGGGGGTPATTASQLSTAGGGGGGVLIRQLFAASALPSSVAVTVGAGGTSAAGSAGGNGGASSFSTLSATGGTGASLGTTSTTGGAQAVGGGIGGTGSGNDVGQGRGQRGGIGYSVYNAGMFYSGGGAGSFYGMGGNPIVGGASAGGAGVSLGAGGAGAAANVSTAAQAGGAGIQGYVKVREYYFSLASPATQTGTADTLNRIVNPAMQISQETAKNTNIVTNGQFAADQWQAAFVMAVGSPVLACFPEGTGYPAYIRMNSQTTANPSPAAGDYYLILQPIEGDTINDLNWGSVSAKSVVLRFDARSNYAGTFGVAIRNGLANDRTFLKNTTIPGDNTWRTYTIAIPGDTTGTWVVDNTRAMAVYFSCVAGSNFIGTDGVWQAGSRTAATGVSNWMSGIGLFLDIGNVGLYADPNNTGQAPPFVTPRYDDELRRCKRYWNSLVTIVDTAAASQILVYPVQMRASPTFAGGGAGFLASQTNTQSVQLTQTTRAVQTVTFNARL